MVAIVSAIFGFIEFIVGMRFLFLFLGADPTATFVAWVYAWSTPFIAPFAGILGQPITNTVGTVVRSVFEPSSLVALAIYGVIGGLLLRFIGGRSAA